MKNLITRSVAVAAVSGLTLTGLTTPASAEVLDADAVAAQICAPGTQVPDYYDAESVDYAERAEATLYVYETSAAIDGDEDTGVIPVPQELCVFAIVTTDEDATLKGSYKLDVAPGTLLAPATSAAGSVSGTESATTALRGMSDIGQVATFTASGQQTATDVDTPTKGEKKRALKKYSAEKKSAKKKYARSSKNAKAKRSLSKKLATAKKKYRASIATKRTSTVRPYSLTVSLPIDR